VNLKSILRGFLAIGRSLCDTPVTKWRYYARFWLQWLRFRRAGGEAAFDNLYPCLGHHLSSPSKVDSHYFYQNIWALKRLASFAPEQHYDIASQLDGFAGQATAICKVVFCDLRQPALGHVPDLSFMPADLMKLPFEDQSIHSLSCLHVVEHIGLGRYGDQLDPEGTTKALTELARVLAPGGQLLLSLPVGRERTRFNAHRVRDARKVVDSIKGLKLVEFLAVYDSLDGIDDIESDMLQQAYYLCGLFRFTR